MKERKVSPRWRIVDGDGGVDGVKINEKNIKIRPQYVHPRFDYVFFICKLCQQTPQSRQTADSASSGKLFISIHFSIIACR